MKNFFCMFSTAIAVALFLAVPLSAQYGDTVKIMTYNIDYEQNKNTQYEGIISVIKAIDPTIASLQKLDSCMGTGSNPCYVAKLLGDQTNMSYTFVTADPKQYGNGFLTKQPPKSVRKLLLTGSATYPRAVLEIGVTVGGEAVRVFVTHLDISGAATRTSEVQQILTWMDSGGAKTVPAVIMADFNAQSTEACMTKLTDAGFVFIKTSTGVILDTAQKINHILYRPEGRWKIVDVGNPNYSASNRYPLWALMSLLNPVAVKPVKFENTGDRGRLQVTIGKRDIRCTIPSRAVVTLRLFDQSGKRVGTLVNGKALDPGPHSFAMPENGLNTGTYILESSVNGIKAFHTIVKVK
jgi:endonuclease/exonuclease/phosphatase family metal-dependent hydrolase